MTEATPVTAHVHRCVQILVRRLNELVEMDEPRPLVEGYDGVLELVDLPWDEATEEDALFREGYETCLLDIVDHLANLWGVDLPEMKARENE